MICFIQSESICFDGTNGLQYMYDDKVYNNSTIIKAWERK